MLGGCDTSCVTDQDSGAERHINIHLSPEIMGGVYANFANVSHSDYEFTVTFARVDHEVESEEVPGVVVSRVNLSPRFMRELIDAMEDNYSKWRTREGIKNLPEYGGGEAPRPASRTAARSPPAQRLRAGMRPWQRLPCSMKVAVISDIHANRHAFEATLEAVAASDAAELWCLGDLVGYGAEPDACVELAREHAAVCLAGNHDLAVTGEIPLDEFSRGASLAAQWTREVIAPENLAFLESLQPAGAGGARGPLPRQPARPGLGVRALDAAGGAVPGRPATPHLPDRPLPRGALVRAPRAASSPPASRGATARCSTSARANGC